MNGLELFQFAQQNGLGDAPGIWSLLGMEIEKVDDGLIEFSLDTRPDMANPLGTLHGGICATLLDSVMGCAVHTTLAEGVGYTTVDLNVTYLRPGSTDGQRITATGTVVHRGSKISTATGEVRNADGKLLATGTTSCIILGSPTEARS